MAIVRKAVARDLDRIYPLFLKLENPKLTKEDWRLLFIDHWKCNEGYFGYVLEEKDSIVGFLGMIFSRRTIDGKEAKFCNLTSWVVEDNFRNQSLSLFIPVMKLKDYTVSSFTASKEVYSVAKKFGFKDLESNLRIIFPVPSVSTWLTFCEIDINGKRLSENLNGKALQAYKDHLPFKCFNVHIQTPLGKCYLIGSRVYRKKLAFSQIHHISHSKVFSKFAGRIALSICSSLNTIAIILDERFLKGHKVRFSISWALPNPRVYKPSSFGEHEIDSLYSELPILKL